MEAARRRPAEQGVSQVSDGHRTGPLDRLDLPADTRHLAELRQVLAAGHENHHRSPGARDDAVRSCS